MSWANAPRCSGGNYANAPRYSNALHVDMVAAMGITQYDTSMAKLKNIKDCYNQLEKDYTIFEMRSYDEMFISKFSTKILTTVKHFGLELRDHIYFPSPYTPHIERTKSYIRDAMAQLLDAKEKAQIEYEK